MSSPGMPDHTYLPFLSTSAEVLFPATELEHVLSTWSEKMHRAKWYA